jgi:hypothetical protein
MKCRLIDGFENVIEWKIVVEGVEDVCGVLFVCLYLRALYLCLNTLKKSVNANNCVG